MDSVVYDPCLLCGGCGPHSRYFPFELVSVLSETQYFCQGNRGRGRTNSNQKTKATVSEERNSSRCVRMRSNNLYRPHPQAHLIMLYISGHGN